MVTVATCSNDAEAMLLKSLLEASGIEAFVPEELTASVAVDYAGHGIRVMVTPENADEARRVLAAATAENHEAEATDEEEEDEA